jgi:hypothetical protein
MRRNSRGENNHARLAALWCWPLVAAILLCAPRRLHSESSIVLVPRLRAGQVLQYRTLARIKRLAHTGSHVAISPEPGETQTEISTNVVVTIKEVRVEKKRPVVTVHAELESPPDSSAGDSAKGVKGKLDFTIAGDGKVSKLEGLDDVEAEQRIAWQFWVSQFAYGWALPAKGISLGEKWKTEEAENTPTPIGDLAWERETTYVRNDKCPVVPSETCAVLLTDAKLKQKSSPVDTTPESYKLHQLKTSGIAKGTNETITYVSLKTHLVMRAKEDVQQMMDAIVAKADGSNEVRYLIQANSQFEIVFIAANSSSK